MGHPRDLALRGPDAIVMLTDVVPWFDARDDVDVEVHDDQPTLREATEDPLISLTVADAADATGERAANDWFDLGVEVSVDGQVIDFATLFMALDRGDELLILPSGTWLRLDRPDLARLRALILEARGLADPTADGATRINRFQLSWWDELTALGVVAEQSARWSDDVARLSALAAPEPVAPPSRLQASLRHYQQDGLDWLAFLHRNRLGGILADDMGLGKTVQALALCLHVLEAQPDARFLVVAPTSVVENWAREVARFAPDVTVCAVRETQARRGTTLVDEIGDASIVVTSYALFRIEYDDYAAQAWEALFVDEAQFVKNHQGKTYQCVRRLDVATKVAMTGTPLENTLMDLWSLLSITAPGLYPDPKRFSDTYRKPIEAGNAPELLATLQRRIAPLMRRRTKSAVLTELPPKTEQIVEVELSARHAKIYQTQLQRERQKVLGLVGDMQKNRFTIFTSLTLLRQLALDPGLVDDTHDTVGSAKLDRLLDDLTQVIAEGHRALVFSQFTRYLKRVRARLDDAGIGHSYLDGRTRKRERGHRPVQGRRGAGVRRQPQGRRVRAEPHRGRLLLRARPLVEPRRRGPGGRPDPSHRAAEPGDGVPLRLDRDDRGEGRRAPGPQGRPVRHRDGQRGRAVRRADRGRHPRSAGPELTRTLPLPPTGDPANVGQTSSGAAQPVHHDLDTREIAEGVAICSDYRAIEGLGGGGDDQVVGPSWHALGPDLDQKFGVRLGDVEVVVENWDRGDDVVDVVGPCGLMPAVGEEGADSKFRDRDRRDRNVVVVIDDLVETLRIVPCR